MKISSFISILSSFLLLGFVLVIALPSLALIKKGEMSTTTTEQPISDVVSLTRMDFIRRDYCNTQMSSMSFRSGVDADLFLENCLSKSEFEEVPTTDSPLLGLNDNNATSTRLTGDELITKCNEFMTRARFDSEKSASNFLKNCLAGK